MKKLAKGGIAIAIGLALTATGAQVANAGANFWSEANYTGYVWSGSGQSIGSLGAADNDTVSSVSSSGSYILNEDTWFTGRSVEYSSSRANLQNYQENLNWWENWNDRASSLVAY